MLESFTERVLEMEKLGKGGVTDLLSVGFPSDDYVGHDFGPESPVAREICIETDQVLGKLFKFIDSSIGMSNVVVVFAAGHGVAPMPAQRQRAACLAAKSATG